MDTGTHALLLCVGRYELPKHAQAERRTYGRSFRIFPLGTSVYRYHWTWHGQMFLEGKAAEKTRNGSRVFTCCESGNTLVLRERRRSGALPSC